MTNAWRISLVLALVAMAVLMAGGTRLRTGSAQTPTPGAPVDFAAVQQREIDALNNGDVAGTLAYLTDNATFQGAGGCISPCVGKAAIQKEYENEVAKHTHVTRVNFQVSGSTVTGRFEVTNDAIKAAGVDRIAGTFTTVFTGDKISSIVLQIDTTDPQTAKFIASLTAKPPATGSGGYLARGSSAPWLELVAVAAAATLLLLGLGCLRWSAKRIRH